MTNLPTALMGCAALFAATAVLISRLRVNRSVTSNLEGSPQQQRISPEDSEYQPVRPLE
jgi:hypothetical protein